MVFEIIEGHILFLQIDIQTSILRPFDSFKHLIKPVPVGHRHKGTSLFVIRGMQRKRKSYRKPLIRQFSYLRYDPASWYRNVPLAYIKPVIIGNYPYETQNLFIIVKRLARSHGHDIRDTLSCIFHDTIYLAGHLSCCKIPCQPVYGWGTEAAAHTAACLRWYAYRIAVIIPHEHALNQIAVIKPEQILPCPVESRFLNPVYPDRENIIPCFSET